jgi:methyl-accepting chemotaxis protein
MRIAAESALLGGLTMAASSVVATLAFGAIPVNGPSFALTVAQDCFVGAMVVVAAAIYMRRHISGPLTRLSRILVAISEGKTDLSADIRLPARNELGSLSRHYGDFVANINEIIGTLKTMIDASTEIGENVEAATVKAATLSGRWAIQYKRTRE